MEYFSVDGRSGIYILTAHARQPDRAPAGRRRHCGGSARWRIRTLSSRLSLWRQAATGTCWHTIPLKGNTGANQSSERSRRSQGSVICWRSGPQPQLPASLPLSCLACLWTPPLPPHTCLDTGKQSRAGPLGWLLNQTRSQISITPCNHPDPQCPDWA